MKLHIGCGPQRLGGWINIDNQNYDGVDELIDIGSGLPYADAAATFIYAEHFIEHLPLDVAMRFFRECRRVLNGEGVLRLSTPNLDWVWLTHYRHPGELDAETAVSAALEINRAFRGWGHHFLYNAATLESALRDAGFSTFVFPAYGTSEHMALRGIERHERATDHPDAAHIVIVEASGIAEGRDDFAVQSEEYRRDFEVR